MRIFDVLGVHLTQIRWNPINQFNNRTYYVPEDRTLCAMNVLAFTEGDGYVGESFISPSRAIIIKWSHGIPRIRIPIEEVDNPSDWIVGDIDEALWLALVCRF